MNTKSWEIITMECIKSWGVNHVVRTVEGTTVGRSKSQGINPVVRTVSYSGILRRNILPSLSIDAHNKKNIGYQHATFVQLKSYFSRYYLCDSPVGCV